MSENHCETDLASYHTHLSETDLSPRRSVWSVWCLGVSVWRWELLLALTKGHRSSCLICWSFSLICVTLDSFVLLETFLLDLFLVNDCVMIGWYLHPSWHFFLIIFCSEYNSYEFCFTLWTYCWKVEIVHCISSLIDKFLKRGDVSSRNF